MNLELRDPFADNCPESIEDCLNLPGGTVCSFNRRGTLLAVGYKDGKIIVWDFHTRGIARVLLGHEKSVSSLSWSKNGRTLLSSSNDCTVKSWDVIDGKLNDSFRCKSAVLFAQIHPRGKHECVACCARSEFAVRIDTLSGTMKPIDHSSPGSSKDHAGGATRSSGKDKKVHTTAVCYDKYGRYMVTGTSNGSLFVLDASLMRVVQHLHVGAAVTIKSVRFSRSGEYVLANCSDRCLRTYRCSAPPAEPSGEKRHSDAQQRASHPPSAEMKEDGNVMCETGKFQDTVNRHQWNVGAFSCDEGCDYVVGGSAVKSKHSIYIWSKDRNVLERVLEGPKEGVFHVEWHPLRPIIVSITAKSGLVYIWATNHTENWSAFAPDFTELEENEEYVEREDEFDLQEVDRKKREEAEEGLEVDIITVPPIKAYSSESDDDVWFLPTDPCPDEAMFIGPTGPYIPDYILLGGAPAPREVVLAEIELEKKMAEKSSSAPKPSSPVAATNPKAQQQHPDNNAHKKKHSGSTAQTPPSKRHDDGVPTPSTTPMVPATPENRTETSSSGADAADNDGIGSDPAPPTAGGASGQGDSTLAMEAAEAVDGRARVGDKRARHPTTVKEDEQEDPDERGRGKKSLPPNKRYRENAPSDGDGLQQEEALEK